MLESGPVRPARGVKGDPAGGVSDPGSSSSITRGSLGRVLRARAGDTRCRSSDVGPSSIDRAGRSGPPAGSETVTVGQQHDTDHHDETTDQFLGGRAFTEPDERDRHRDRGHQIQQGGRRHDRQSAHRDTPQDETQRGGQQPEIQRAQPRTGCARRSCPRPRQSHDSHHPG